MSSNLKPNKNFVIVESPFKGRDEFEQSIHERYLKLCLQDCILKGENPFASHGFYVHFLDDNKPVERKIGISCSIAYYEFINKSAVYMDLGISEGMNEGIKYAKSLHCQIEFRSIAHLKEVKQLIEYKKILNESRKTP